MQEEQQTHAGASVVEIPDLELPPQCKVVIFNDDFTTKEFVVEILVQIFHKNNEEAVSIMESVHNEGSGVVGIYTYDIAMTRTQMATARARKAGFPLRLEVQKA